MATFKNCKDCNMTCTFAGKHREINCMNFKGETESTESATPTGQAEFDLLSCKRWHEAEIVALKKYLADENADNSPLAESMRKNLRCKITQHGTFVKALTIVTT